MFGGMLVVHHHKTAYQRRGTFCHSTPKCSTPYAIFLARKTLLKFNPFIAQES